MGPGVQKPVALASLSTMLWCCRLPGGKEFGRVLEYLLLAGVRRSKDEDPPPGTEANGWR